MQPDDPALEREEDGGTRGKDIKNATQKAVLYLIWQCSKQIVKEYEPVQIQSEYLKQLDTNLSKAEMEIIMWKLGDVLLKYQRGTAQQKLPLGELHWHLSFRNRKCLKNAVVCCTFDSQEEREMKVQVIFLWCWNYVHRSPALTSVLVFFSISNCALVVLWRH